MGLAIFGGIFAFLLVGATVGELVLHKAQAESAWFSGLIAAAWCVWPALKAHQVERYNTLSPVPTRYNHQWKNAYAKVREILDRAVYNMGSRWHVTTSDTVAKHIHAVLQFTDEEGKWEAPSGRLDGINYRTEKVKRLVELDIQFKEQDDQTIVQLDFRTQADGNNAMYACDRVVQDFKNAIDRELGPGTAAGNPAEFVMTAPPWWLLGLSAVGLLSLWSDVMTAVFGK